MIANSGDLFKLSQIIIVVVCKVFLFATEKRWFEFLLKIQKITLNNTNDK